MPPASVRGKSGEKNKNTRPRLRSEPPAADQGPAARFPAYIIQGPLRLPGTMLRSMAVRPHTETPAIPKLFPAGSTLCFCPRPVALPRPRVAFKGAVLLAP